MSQETLYHVTVMSNFARAYDKYARTYSKQAITESRFPDQFFLLRQNELSIGVNRAANVLNKADLFGDRLLALCTTVASNQLSPNMRTGLGRSLGTSCISIDRLYEIGPSGLGKELSIEDAYAASLAILNPRMKPFAELAPRSVSILPIAQGCQAACPFCFSKGSASSDQPQQPLDLNRVDQILKEGREHGAERAVITGGGEPGLVGLDRLSELIKHCRKIFPKVVLITNGYFLTSKSGATPSKALSALAEAGLSVLVLSRHHENHSINASLMNLPIDAEEIARTWSEGQHAGLWPDLAMRWTCVLQKGGVDSIEGIDRYLSWSTRLGVHQICFKELYVASSLESVYYAQAANLWSYEHQVPLRLVLDFVKERCWRQTDSLPWGAPIFEGIQNGVKLQVAAYTEPSVFWERTHGIARSWNVMADGTCLVSLEDRLSAL